MFLILISCVGSDTSFLPNTIEKAKNDKLLINIYEPSLRKIKINDTSYFLEDAFTTFKYNSTKDLTINKNFFAFILQLKNIKTGENTISSDNYINYTDYINFKNDQGGIHDSTLGIVYDDISKRNGLDTIIISFKDHSKKEVEVKFIKKK